MSVFRHSSKYYNFDNGEGLYLSFLQVAVTVLVDIVFLGITHPLL